MSMSTNMTVYIGYGEGANPGKFENDIVFKNWTPQRKLVLNKNNIPTDTGYTLAVEVHGYDYGANTPHSNIVNIDTK